MFCAMYIMIAAWIYEARHPGQPIPMPKCPISARRFPHGGG